MVVQIANIAEKKEIIYKNEEAVLKLKEFGFTYEDIESATIFSIKETNELSKYAYSLEKNTKFFFCMIKNFRKRLCARGWTIDDKYNLNRTLPPNKKIAFVFSSGDKNVCSEHITPMTKNQKGEVSLATVEMNNIVQLSLLHNLFLNTEITPEKYDIGEIPHWFILFYKNKIYIEISLPAEIDIKTKKIYKWSQRVILPAIEYKEDLIKDFNKLSKNERVSSYHNKEEELNITRK